MTLICTEKSSTLTVDTLEAIRYVSLSKRFIYSAVIAVLLINLSFIAGISCLSIHRSVLLVFLPYLKLVIFRDVTRSSQNHVCLYESE